MALRARRQAGAHRPVDGGARQPVPHCGDLAMVALSTTRPVGVDVQQLVADTDARRVAGRFFPSAEARFVAEGRGRGGPAGRFTVLWTRKEASVKAAGGGLARALAPPVHGPSPVVVHQPTGRYLVSDVPAPSGFRAAVALQGTAPYRVTRRWWRRAARH